MSTPTSTGPERFCSQCGDSLVPLARPHVARTCAECGKTKHLVEIASGGGITIRGGDRFTIPAGWIQISLSPASRGKLARPGLKFLLRQFFYIGEPNSAADIDGLLKKYEDIADRILQDSALLKGIDQETPEGAKEAVEILEKDRTTREWHAVLLGTFAKLVADAIAANNTSEAAWAMYQAAQAHAMVVTTEPTFEQTLWRGYLANQVVYEAAIAAVSTPAEAEAIKALEPLFNRLGEATLYAWVHSGEPIGPRLGVKSLSEPLLKALGHWHLAEAERKRAEEVRVVEEARAARELRVKWAAVGASVGIALCGGIWAVLQTFGIL
jgi:hypothetical protein